MKLDGGKFVGITWFDFPYFCFANNSLKDGGGGKGFLSLSFVSIGLDFS